MDSEYFFKSSIGNDLKTKPGLYVIEQPLFQKNGKHIYKIGYARDNLYKRVRDYKTAYGPVPFIIHVLWAVPEKVYHERANFAHLTEARLHKSLARECAMKDEDFKQNGEWFYDIKRIVSTVKNLQEEYKYDNVFNNTEWYIWFNPEYDNLSARPTTRTIVREKDVKSSLSGIKVIQRTHLKRAVTKPSIVEH
jgi:hypothetical protein